MREAILLVGGQGTRLRPLTINTPKPMLPVAGVPFTVHQIMRARDAGITRIVLATSYRADVFASFIADSDLGIEVVIATEEVPLGTGGAIRFASGFLTGGSEDPVVIFNGDVLTGVDIDALITSHESTLCRRHPVLDKGRRSPRLRLSTHFTRGSGHCSSSKNHKHQKKS